MSNARMANYNLIILLFINNNLCKPIYILLKIVISILLYDSNKLVVINMEDILNAS